MTLIEILLEFYDATGQVPTAKDCEIMQVPLSSFRSAFGSWNNALKAAGLPLHIEPASLSREELLESLRNFYKKHKVSPAHEDFTTSKGLRSPGQYKKEFGSLKNALKEAGLPPLPERKSYTKEELLQSLKNLGEELGRKPKSDEINSSPLCANISTYRSRFGSLNNALELAGFSVTRKNLSKDELKKEILDYYQKTGNVPKLKDCRVANGLRSYNTYKQAFGGTWEGVLEACGLVKSEFRSNQLSDEELLASLQRFYKENSFAPRHEDCNSGDYDYLKSHMIYVRRFGSFTAALRQANVPLNDPSTSGVERELAEALKEVYKGEVITSFKLPNKKEIDIYFPEKKLGIEFDGLYWHSEEFKDKNYHLEKTLYCQKEGITLIHVFEDEWRKKKDIVLSRIQSLLGLNKTIFARNCTVREVKDCSSFLDSNHLQGTCSSSFKLGLFSEEELVSVMTFGKPRFSSDTEWELIRFATKANLNVVGGAGKLLSHFEKVKNPKSLLSYADRRWSTGNLYNSLGFSLIRVSSPSYYYVKGQSRHSRYQFQKHKLEGKLQYFNASLTEHENMLKNGYKRIYDCGNLVFIKKY